MQNNSEERLSPVLVGFLIALPFAVGIIGKSFIVADIFLIFLLVSGLIKSLFEKTLRLDAIDAAFIALVGISLLGKNALVHVSAFVFELASLIFLYLGCRFIARDIAAEVRLFKVTALIGNILRTFLLVAFVVILLRNAGLTEITEIFYSVHGSFKGLFNFTNQLAIFMVCFWPIAMFTYGPRPLKRFCFYAVFFSVMVSVASRSGLWIAVGQTVVLELYFSRDKKRIDTFVRFLALAGVIAMVVSLMATDPGLQRSLGNLEHAPLSFDQPRVKNFREAFNAAPDWLRGYGLGCFDQTHVHEVHNTPFSLLVETGIFGFLISLVIFFKIAAGFYRSKANLAQPDVKMALYLAWAGIIGMGMFHYLLRNRAAWVLLAMTLAFVKISSLKDTAHE